MKTVVVANPAAGAGRVGRRWGQMERVISAALGPVETVFTERCGDATELARRAIDGGAERIAVVGGDGTLNEVVNGFFPPDAEARSGKLPTLALVPAGTGGDFARSIGMCEVPLEQAFAEASERRIDVGRAELTAPDGSPVVRHFVNISSFGSSGLIVQMVNQTTKRLGAKASFLWGTVKGLVKYENQRVRLTLDGVAREPELMNVVAVANGRYFGGSMKIAPGASLDDGLFDVITIGDIDLLDFVLMSRKIYRGEHLAHPQIRHTRAREVIAEPIDGAAALIDLDGEQPGRLPVRYRLIPGALTLLAPWARAEGAGGAAAADVRAS